MSAEYPIISVTGSSGAGTTSVKRTFEQIFRREGIEAAYIEGDAFHRYDRVDMRKVMAEEEAKGNSAFQPFRPDRQSARRARGGVSRTTAKPAPRRRGITSMTRTRRELYGRAPGTFTDWKPLPANTELLFYEGLHGALVTDKVNIAKHADLKIGVVPVINLEWIQKIHRDRVDARLFDGSGDGHDSAADARLHQLYLPAIHRDRHQFPARADGRYVESVHCALDPDRRQIDGHHPVRASRAASTSPICMSMIHDSFMSRANSIVIPGNKLDLAMQLILTPFILQLVERRKADDAREQRSMNMLARVSENATHAEMANAIRVLAMDAVEKANSGHPGMPMGMADVATVLFTRFLKFDPADPAWPDRDRFVLSAGHGSMLLYSLLHLLGYPDVDRAELERFRQLDSKTPGHPEYGHTLGVETTTGPLGQGLAAAVGMALAEKMLAARYGAEIVDHRTYVIAGDGCLMEGISQEAIALAGHLKLSSPVHFVVTSLDITLGQQTLHHCSRRRWCNGQVFGRSCIVQRSCSTRIAIRVNCAGSCT